MSRILLTGASGFIGTNLLRKCVGDGLEALNIDIAPPRDPSALPYWAQCDVTDTNNLSSLIRNFSPDWIIHLAARTDLVGRTTHDYTANTDGVTSLIEATLPLQHLKRVIFASSRLVCRIGYFPSSDVDYCPPNAYGESKMIGEQIVRQSLQGAPWDWLIVRPTSIWGPWFDIPYKLFFESVVRGRYIHPRNVTVHKSFGYVGNTVHQLLTLLHAPHHLINGKTFYLADYPPIEVCAMANQIRSEMNQPPVKQIPLSLLRGVAHLGDLAKRCGMKEPPLTSFRLSNLVTPMTYDLSPLQNIVGTLPYTLEEGVSSTLAWMNRQGLLV